MRNAAILMFVLFAGWSAAADDNPPMDITTADGTLYANATILNVNAATVDISYVDSNGMPVMRCLKIQNLSNDLQSKFNFDPAAAAESERKQTLWRQNEFTQLKNQENELIKQLGLQILQRQGGQNVPIDLDDLYNAVYEGKTMAAGFVISYGPAGALVNITGSSGAVIPDNIIILDLDAPAQSNWAGYIYPTMMVSSQQLNIYCAHPVNAINSVISTLKLDNNNNASANTAVATAASDPAAATTSTTAVSASPAANTVNSSTVIDPNTNTAIPAVNNVYINGGGYYGGGGFVYPAPIQPYIHPWPHPYPYQPHPLYNNNNNNWSNRNNFNNDNRGGEYRPNTTPGGNFTAPRSDFSGRGWGSGGGGHFRR